MPQSMFGIRRVMVMLLAVSAGCGDSVPSPAEPAVRDSAGVAIVENGPDVADPEWAGVSVEQDLEIGAGGAAAEVQFGRIADVAVDVDGHIFVLDVLERAVRVFAADGTGLRTVGGAGEGPGEFSRFVNGLVLVGDTLLVTDWGNRRVSRFAADGSFAGMHELGAAGGGRSWWHAAPDGTLRARVQHVAVNPEGRFGFDDVLLSLPAPDATADTVLEFDYAKTDIGGPGAIRAALIVNTPAWTLLDDGSIAWTALDLAEVRVHGADGGLRRIIRRDAWAPRLAGTRDREVLIDLLGEKMERLGGTRTSLAEVEIPPLETLPVLTSVLAGPRGTLWVQRGGDPATFHPMSINAPESPFGLGGAVWDVLTAEGRFLTTVTLPAPIQVMRVVDNALHGVRRDSLGIETVVRLRVDGLPGAAGR